jgi:hypothetical protein
MWSTQLCRKSYISHCDATNVMQTYDFVAKMHEEWGKFDKMQLGVWEAIALLNEVVDDSDPDTALPQIEHLLQTAEACRKAFPKVRCTPHEPMQAVDAPCCAMVMPCTDVHDHLPDIQQNL